MRPRSDRLRRPGLAQDRRLDGEKWLSSQLMAPRSRRRVRAGSWLLLALVALVPLSRSATAAQLRRSHLNPIQLENRLPGTTAWQIQTPALNGQISGYGSAQSVAPGQRISFFVSTKASRFT